MLPTWGDKVTKAWVLGPCRFSTPQKCQTIWIVSRSPLSQPPEHYLILGGDHDFGAEEPVWAAMAAGLRRVRGQRFILRFILRAIALHLNGFRGVAWMDFNLLQSGHGREWTKLRDDPEGLQPYAGGSRQLMASRVMRMTRSRGNLEELGWFDDYDVRQAARLGGVCRCSGHTYGCNDIWQMKTPSREPVSKARGEWHQDWIFRVCRPDADAFAD